MEYMSFLGYCGVLNFSSAEFMGIPCREFHNVRWPLVLFKSPPGDYIVGFIHTDQHRTAVAEVGFASSTTNYLHMVS